MIDEERIREIVNRYIRLDEEVRVDGGYYQHMLHLTDGHDESILEAGPQASLRARRDLMELVLMGMVREVLTCDECGTSGCVQRDSDICIVIQVMES